MKMRILEMMISLIRKGLICIDDDEETVDLRAKGKAKKAPVKKLVVKRRDD